MADNIVLWDMPFRRRLLPFTYTRPVGHIRIGILTIAEKYESYLGSPVSCLSEEYLLGKYPARIESENIFVNGNILPDEDFIHAIKQLKNGQVIIQDDNFIAGKFHMEEAEAILGGVTLNPEKIIPYGAAVFLNNIWQIFSLNERELIKDYELVTKGRKSQPIHPSNYTRNPENIFIEEGAIVENASLNASAGPIYIGKDAEVMEGAMIRGPFSLGEHSTVKLGAKIYGGTSIGPHCKIGGEVSNSVFFGYANKGHDGFVGNAVIGEWCNIGADSNNSNLKNNYEEVKVWSYEKNSFERTGLQFCGLFMGDHSKCGINTMFNTGTVVGVSSNIFGGGFPRNFIPSFSWGGASGYTTYQMSKALETAARVMQRRNVEITEQDVAIFNHIFEETKQYRNF
jgi:UDP-N-acetylglucosamine diphosphorylase/glucosamine-1-phosphate N-acetyltransferase